MRHTLFLILIWLPLLICATDKNVNITIKLSTELSQTEQWIYASGYVGDLADYFAGRTNTRSIKHCSIFKN